MAVTFISFLRAGDFGAGLTATDQVVTAGQYNQIGSKTVGAQQTINWGAGVIANGVDSRETAKCSFDSASGVIAGVYRLATQDANGINTIPVIENDNVNFLAGVPLGLKVPGAREDSKLLILFKPDSTTTIDYSDSDNIVNIPVTIANLN